MHAWFALFKKCLFSSQRWSHLPHLSWGRQQRGSPVPMWLHGHFGYSAQELLREVAVVFQHQLLWALPHRVQHRAPTEASHRGNKGQCPLPCLQQSFSSSLFVFVALLFEWVCVCVCMKVKVLLIISFSFCIPLLACFLVTALLSLSAPLWFSGLCLSLTSLGFPLSTVAPRSRAPKWEENTVLWHGVLPVHHSSSSHFWLALPEGRSGPPPAEELAAGRGPHCSHHCPFHHLRPLDFGKKKKNLHALLL